jgi:threonine dehydratase
MEVYEEARRAQERIRSHIVATPVSRSRFLSELLQAEVYLKNEHVQHTGSFKLRGAMNKLLSLSDAQCRAGVLAASTGNHGLAVAFAAKKFGVPAKVIAPVKAAARKLEAIRALGAELTTVAGDCLAAELTAKELARRQGRVFISPYNDPEVVAGQGTIGLELQEQTPRLDMLLAAVGGGGLIAGIGGVMKHLNPAVRVVGCWPENSAVMHACLKAGRIMEVPETETISDATTGGLEPGSITFDLCAGVIDDAVLVSEQEIRAALVAIGREESWIVEGAAGVPVAAAIQQKEKWRGKSIAIILCGRNIDFEKYRSVICAQN